MTTLFAQPYDISATGFYFDTAAEYSAKAAKLKNDYGQPVEEFEIQFIDGTGLDAKLFEALGVNQANHEDFLEAVTDWSDDDKIKVIIAVAKPVINSPSATTCRIGSRLNFIRPAALPTSPHNLSKKGFMARYPSRSETTLIMTPSPATSALSMATFSLTAPGTFTGAGERH